MEPKPLTYFTKIMCISLILLGSISEESVANKEKEEQIINAWSEKLADLSNEEKELLKKVAQEKLTLHPVKGIFPKPGKNSEIVRNPVFFDFVKMMEKENKQLDAIARALVDQTQDRFFFLETGLSIETERFEDIDILIFELTYSPEIVSTYSKMPMGKTKKLLTLGWETKLEMGGDLKVGLVGRFAKKINAKASAKAIQNLFLEWKQEYNVKTVEIATVGINQPKSRWTILADDLIRDDLRFIVVLRIPKNITKVQIKVRAQFIDKRLQLMESINEKYLTYICKTQSIECKIKPN